MRVKNGYEYTTNLNRSQDVSKWIHTGFSSPSVYLIIIAHIIVIFQPVGKKTIVRFCSDHRRRLQSGVSLLTSHLLLQMLAANLSPLRQSGDGRWASLGIWLEWRLALLTQYVAASLLAFPSFNLIDWASGTSAETRQSDRNPTNVTWTFSMHNTSFYD